MEFARNDRLRPTLSRRAVLTAAGAGAIAIAARRPRLTANRRDAQAGAEAAWPPADLLRLVPDPYPAALGQVTPLAYYADVAGQLAAVGLTPPTDPESEDARLWNRVLLGMALPGDIADFASALPWQEMFGWTPYEVEQSLWFGEPPGVVNLLRGRFDAAAVATALLTLGFRAVEIAGATAAYSIEHKDLSIADPDERFLVTSSLRTLAILPDGTYVWSQRPEGARAVATVAAGAASLGARSPVQRLLGAVAEPLASIILVPGLALSGPGDPTELLGAAATPDAVDDLATAIAAEEAARQAMPPIGLALFGVTYGGEFASLAGTPEALPHPASIRQSPTRLRFFLQFGGVDDAERAVPAIEERLETGRSVRTEQPWSEVFRSWSVAVVPEHAVVLVEIDPGAARNAWFGLLFSRDLGFLAW